MNIMRKGIAESLSSSDEESGQGGQVVESKQHEDQEAQVMAEILATVKDIQQKLDALMGAEQKEAEGAAPEAPKAQYAVNQ